MNNIETLRLRLRHIVESDAPDIFSYCSEAHVGPEAGWKPHDNIAETIEIMKLIFIGQANVFGMVDKQNGKMIGSIGLLPDPHRQNSDVLMLGYAMSESYWGLGLMTEAAQAVINRAFVELPVSLISCTCYSDNLRSKRVIEKCKFHYEGCLRQGEKRFDGKVLDVLCFSLLKNECEFK